jgi:hypothetical protein
MQNKKLKVTLSGCWQIFLQTGILNVCSRLVKKIRLRDRSTSNNTGLLTKDWDFDIEEREAEFKDDLRAASGIGHKRRKVSIVALS